MSAYGTILLKLSGETLAGPKASGYDGERVDAVARILIEVAAEGARLAVVPGGGNVWRGRFTDRMNRAEADQMGMLATVMNAIALKEAIRRQGGRARAFSAQEMTRFAQLYTRDAALEALDRGEIALLAGGTGNPFFTTDTGVALRAAELGADAVFKGTNVDGVFDSDPVKNPSAKLFSELTYDQAIAMRLGVMDATAFELCREQRIPIMRVFNMNDLGNILRAARGENIGTVLRA